MTGRDELVEVQATGEGVAFPRSSLDQLLDLAAAGIARLRDRQEEAAGALT
jgi:ribonuclease PH